MIRFRSNDNTKTHHIHRLITILRIVYIHLYNRTLIKHLKPANSFMKWIDLESESENYWERFQPTPPSEDFLDTNLIFLPPFSSIFPAVAISAISGAAVRASFASSALNAFHRRSNGRKFFGGSQRGLHFWAWVGRSLLVYQPSINRQPDAKCQNYFSASAGYFGR